MDIPLVTLIVEDEWNSIADAIVKFKLAPSFARSSWDWIGLYKVTSFIFYSFNNVCEIHVSKQSVVAKQIFLCLSNFNKVVTDCEFASAALGGFQTSQGLCGICVGQTRRSRFSSTRTSGNLDAC